MADDKRQEEVDVIALFPEALKKEEFQVYYQPKVALKDYTLAGAEALCRWLHDGSLLPPFKFIPVYEKNGQIVDLDFYMLDHVCQDMHGWLMQGKRVVRTSVNISRVHQMDEKLIEDILHIIDRNGVPHEYIEIELTETTTDVNFKDLKLIVGGLAENGVHTSVDDFGVGYSSLNLISDLPWNMLKIDKGFVPENGDIETNHHVMLKHIIALAEDMGLECLAEGVETIEQVKLLKESRCMLAQGYFFDKPLPKAEFETRLDF